MVIASVIDYATDGLANKLGKASDYLGELVQNYETDNQAGRITAERITKALDFPLKIAEQLEEATNPKTKADRKKALTEMMQREQAELLFLAKHLWSYQGMAGHKDPALEEVEIANNFQYLGSTFTWSTYREGELLPDGTKVTKAQERQNIIKNWSEAEKTSYEYRSEQKRIAAEFLKRNKDRDTESAQISGGTTSPGFMGSVKKVGHGIGSLVNKFADATYGKDSAARNIYDTGGDLITSTLGGLKDLFMGSSSDTKSVVGVIAGGVAGAVGLRAALSALPVVGGWFKEGTWLGSAVTLAGAFIFGPGIGYAAVNKYFPDGAVQGDGDKTLVALRTTPAPVPVPVAPGATPPAAPAGGAPAGGNTPADPNAGLPPLPDIQVKLGDKPSIPGGFKGIPVFQVAGLEGLEATKLPMSTHGGVVYTGVVSTDADVTRRINAYALNAMTAPQSYAGQSRKDGVHIANDLLVGKPGASNLDGIINRSVVIDTVNQDKENLPAVAAVRKKLSEHAREIAATSRKWVDLAGGAVTPDFSAPEPNFG